jgi:hypothetical protein
MTKTPGLQHHDMAPLVGSTTAGGGPECLGFVLGAHAEDAECVACVESAP